MARAIEFVNSKSYRSKRRAMERYYEQRRRHREWRQLKKRNGQDSASQQPIDATGPHPKISNEPTPNNFRQFSFSNKRNPPQPRYLEPTNCTILPRPIEPPKTPPASSSGSLRRQHASAKPISPPNPLRLASTIASQHLPMPDTSPRFLHFSPPPLCYEYVGHPSLRVFKVKLPSFLAHGPLDALMEAAEAHVNGLPNGWRTNLYSLTKCDIACKSIPGVSSYVKPISMYVTMAMQILYGCQNIKVDKNQPHILKYSAEAGHTGVELHCDRCDITANLSLSKRDTFAGGGTYIAAMHKVVKLEQGEFLLHPGCLVHGGNPITAGTRYLLVTFANFER